MAASIAYIFDLRFSHLSVFLATPLFVANILPDSSSMM